MWHTCAQAPATAPPLAMEHQGGPGSSCCRATSTKVRTCKLGVEGQAPRSDREVTCKKVILMSQTASLCLACPEQMVRLLWHMHAMRVREAHARRLPGSGSCNL